MGTLLFKNGIIVDGTGKDSFPGHVLVEKDKIAAVFRENEDLPPAEKEIDATGCIISPGFIDTDLISDLPDELKKQYKKQVPVQRFGKVEEVASSVMFLASREAAYITGTVLEVTGGL